LIKVIILALLANFQRTFSVYHKKLVYLEGGLGSQILGVISFWERQEKYGVEKVRCDLSYFKSLDRENLWNWELDRFQISLEELQSYESSTIKNIFKLKSDFLSDMEIETKYWVQAREKYLSRFQIDTQLVDDFMESVADFENTELYGAVHIRRGDYLKVATKVIKFDEYLDLLISIQELIPRNLLIVSDSRLDEREKETLVKFFGQSQNLVFLDDPQLDPFLIHCVLREAVLLITSNSTFSFTAALLGKSGQLVFSPVNFHSGQDAEKYNRSFRAAGTFMSLKMEEQ
jgi:hypothetical protein